MFLGLGSIVSAACPADSVIVTNRPDGRFLSSRGAVQRLMKEQPPVLAFNPQMNPEEFARWRGEMKEAMKRLMRHPESEVPAPKRVKTVARDGYRIEKWESYPLSGSVVPFFGDDSRRSGCLTSGSGGAVHSRFRSDQGVACRRDFGRFQSGQAAGGGTG